MSICPRCGRPYNWIERKKVGERVYLYAVHVVGEGKNRRREKCYLGPEGNYEYVTRMHAHEGLVLKGLMDADRALEYLTALADTVLKIEPSKFTWQQLSELAMLFNQLASHFSQLAEAKGAKVGVAHETESARVPSWEEFKAFVERRASEGDEDAKKLLSRMKKDAATVKRVLKLLSSP